MQAMKNHIVSTLHKHLENFNIECYNEATFNWSKGYQKAIIDIIDIVKNSEMQKK